MAVSEANAILATWEAVRDELRRQRGRMNFRGQEEHLLPKREVRIRLERRGSGQASGWVSIHITPRQDDLWAEDLGTGEKWTMEALGCRMEDWLSAILAHCRGGNYLRTNSSEASYRKAAEIPVTQNEGGEDGSV